MRGEGGLWIFDSIRCTGAKKNNHAIVEKTEALLIRAHGVGCAWGRFEPESTCRHPEKTTPLPKGQPFSSVVDATHATRAHLDTTTGTPDLSGSCPCDISLCRINPAFRLAGPSLWVVVSRCARFNPFRVEGEIVIR